MSWVQEKGIATSQHLTGWIRHHASLGTALYPKLLHPRDRMENRDSTLQQPKGPTGNRSRREMGHTGHLWPLGYSLPQPQPPSPSPMPFLDHRAKETGGAQHALSPCTPVRIPRLALAAHTGSCTITRQFSFRQASLRPQQELGKGPHCLLIIFQCQTQKTHMGQDGPMCPTAN